MPEELQRQVHATVQETKERSGWSAQRTRQRWEFLVAVITGG